MGEALMGEAMRQSWQYLYRGKAWRELRLQVLADEPLCRMCAAIGFAAGATVVDHIRAHKGEQALFWDRSNLQALCKPCHDRHAQRRDRGGDASAIGLDGWPIKG